jgi:SAM-dependent methyltransferase
MNVDKKVVNGFGDEWVRFDNEARDQKDLDAEFYKYFSIFPFEVLTSSSVGFDAGCGNGRWAKYIAPKVCKLHLIEPSHAIKVAKNKLGLLRNIEYHKVIIDDMPLEDNSQDFGYCLGVLHHIPNTEQSMQSCVNKLKTGAPFLVYMYYNFENRPVWFKIIWRISDVFRGIVSRLPFKLKLLMCDLIAVFVYFPLAKIANILEKLRFDVRNVPLSSHRKGTFYNMRNTSLDRFGTRLEKRFSKNEIEQMMKKCGLTNIKFSECPDSYWTAIGIKA